MNKNERHEFEKRNIGSNAIDFFLCFFHFLIAILWIIGMIITIQPNALVIVIGVLLISSNCLNFVNIIVRQVEKNKVMSEWKNKVRSEITDDIRKELNLAE